MSTLLTLIVIPVLYSLVDDIMAWLVNKLRSKKKIKKSIEPIVP